MKRSEGYYGAAIGVVLAVAALGDSDYEIWSVIALIGILAATGFVYAGRIFEGKEKGRTGGGFYKKWEK